ncbi:hypothetical protein XI09_39320 [Bradyrhizobium sp. CCBAU 11386]|uniref:hypothetical protein n=1 Tax=Bradyrhizobium sp. CCBAU 11386 TaxID=1630837 RepID=UPI0023042BED|nr:hypothetical protein [Bradyrhizobium sp. CCBAU 11386]MDA9510603.1 hypothetical protein [Bradyrhizobium sp. CCBAU 11386]
MTEAIELIVEGYARLGDRRALEDLRMHRRRLAVDLKAMTGFDCSGSIQQIEDEIAVVEAGLMSLPDIAADAGSEFPGASHSALLPLGK